MYFGERCDPLAQSVEHLTFNQGVRSSSLRWITKQNPELFCAPGSVFNKPVYEPFDC